MKIATLAVAAAVLAIVGCSSITKTPAPASTAPAALASTKATPSPSSSLSGPVGTVYTVTDPSGNKMAVALTKVIDPAQGADQFTTPHSGKVRQNPLRFVLVRSPLGCILGCTGWLSSGCSLWPRSIVR